MADPGSKVPLPAFLKMLTSNNISPAKAMSITGKLYKTCNTPAALAELTDFQLQDAGISSAEERKQVLAAVRKSGYKSTSPAKRSISAAKRPPRDDPITSPGTSKGLLPETSVSAEAVSSPGTGKVKRKRKRDDERNEFLPDRPSDELEEQAYGSLDFNEVLDEEVLRSKYVVVNRAPIMTAWSCIVAERLGFSRQEALSIASVYTEMNAISKGVAIGIYAEDKKSGVEASKGGSQPYVDLMGRRVPLFQTAKESWRALSSGSPVSPASGFSYITRSLRQTAPFIVGALQLLADSYTHEELNKHGFSLYAEFRPEVKEWGDRGEVRCEKILNLRKGAPAGLNLGPSGTAQDTNRSQHPDGAASNEPTEINLHEDADKIEESPRGEETQPDQKKPRTMTLEEYEATLDDDDAFADVNLDFPNVGDDT